MRQLADDVMNNVIIDDAMKQDTTCRRGLSFDARNRKKQIYVPIGPNRFLSIVHSAPRWKFHSPAR